MFDKLTDKFKKEVSDFTARMELKFSEFWGELMTELQEKKMFLEEETELLTKKKEELAKESDKLVNDITRLKEIKTQETQNLEENFKKQKTLAGKIQELEKGIEAIIQREKFCDVREREQNEKQRQLKAKELSLEERERAVKRVFDKLDTE